MEFDDKNYNQNENNSEEKAYISQFSEIEGLESDDYVPENQIEKKKFFVFRYIQPSIFIAICVFLAALIAFGVYWAFGSKTITGAWAYSVPNDAVSTADEASSKEDNTVYYVFEKADSEGKGKFYVYNQGAEESGNYTITDDGEHKILSFGGSELYYEVSGNRLFGNAELKLTQPAYTDESTGQTVKEQTITMKGAKAPDYEDQTIEDYKIDEKLVGEWESERTFLYYYYELNYTENVKITEDGMIKINYNIPDLGMNRTVYYAYSADNGKLTIQRVTSKDKESVKYTLKKGSLTFEDKTTDSIVYDSIFGDDVTYYKPGSKAAETAKETTAAEKETTTTQTTPTAK